MSNPHYIVALGKKFDSREEAFRYWDEKIRPLLYIDNSTDDEREGAIILGDEYRNIGVTYHSGTGYWVEVELYDLTTQEDFIVSENELFRLRYMFGEKLQNFTPYFYFWYDGTDRP